jgi:hypothetical protein
MEADGKSCRCKLGFVEEPGVGGGCTCPPGQMLIGTQCEPCEVGKYKEGYGINACNLCDGVFKGSTTDGRGGVSREECKCPVSRFLGEGGTCEKVEDGGGVVGSESGLTLETLILKKGWWRVGVDTLDIRECPVEEACVGGNSSEVDGYCREGHTGPYCHLCVDDFSADVFGLCQKCDAGTRSILSTVGAGLGVIAFCAFLYLVVWKRCLKKVADKYPNFVESSASGGKILLVM